MCVSGYCQFPLTNLNDFTGLYVAQKNTRHLRLSWLTSFLKNLSDIKGKKTVRFVAHAWSVLEGLLGIQLNLCPHKNESKNFARHLRHTVCL